MSLDIIFFVSLIVYVGSIKIGTYNTFQIVTNPLALRLRDRQIAQIGDSDIDVLCLQELLTLPDIFDYTTKLASVGFTNSFSQFNIQSEISPQNLDIPRIPCNELEINALNSTCGIISNCQKLYSESSYYDYAQCMALYCPSDYDKLLYSECVGCLMIYPIIQESILSIPRRYTSDFNGAAAFCFNPPSLSDFDFQDILYNLTDGAVITTRSDYRIKNTWSFILPSWLFIEKRLQIAEIDICKETDPNNADCQDSIIVGCTHLGLLQLHYQ